MKIPYVVTDSMIDYPGRFSLVLFNNSCNFNCPTCYAKRILKKKEMLDAKSYLSDWTTGVVFLGGEPTTDMGIFDCAKELKSRGLSIKLDTNGSNPDVISRLLEENLLDYVAMDIKGPKILYPRLIGKENATKILLNIEESMRILTGSGIGYEFRTTVVPYLVDNKITFFNKMDIREIAEWLTSTTGNNKHKYYLQKFYHDKKLK